MKIIFFAFALLVAANSLRAEQLRAAPVAEIVQQAIPALTYVVGDKGWGGGGGLFDNAYAGSIIFDANTSFAVFRSQDSALSATAAAKQVRDHLLKRFAFPMTQSPSSAWEKKGAPGLPESDYGEAAFVSFGVPSDLSSPRVLVSVQVARRTATEFGITVRYTTVTNDRPN